MSFSFTILGRLDSLNNMINQSRGNYHAANKAKRDAELLVMQYARYKSTGARPQNGDFPLMVAVKFYEATAKRDVDNIIGAGMKIILDALQEAKIMPNDNQKHIRGERCEVHIDRVNPRIEVTLLTREEYQ